MTTTNTTALATADARTDRAAFEPATLSEALHVSQVLVASRLLPRAIQTPEAAFAVIATGRELGLSAMQALRAIHIVEGKPTLSADLMVALVKRSPECVFFRMVESSAERATYETQRRGEPSPTRLGYTIEEAKASGAATKDNWRKFPAAMLRARAASALARAVYPDLVLGVYDPDELDVRDTGPVAVPAPVAVPVVVSSAPVAVAVETPAAPAPAARRSRKAEPAPVVVDVEPVAPVEPARTALDEVLDELAIAADLATACALFDGARARLEPAQLPAVFGALLAGCRNLPDTNQAAGVLTAWKAAGVSLPADVSAAMRAAYSARRAELQKGGV